MSFRDKLTTMVFDVAVGICGQGKTSELDGVEWIHAIKSTYNTLAVNPVVITADPFLFVKDDTLYLFYEEQRGAKGKGIIKMTSTEGLKEWTKPVTVLEEAFHLSYPYVFEHQGRIYMMPEAGHNIDIRLYRMGKDLCEWRYDKTLLKGENFVDSVIYTKGDYAYLLTSVYKGDSKYELRLYIGDKELNNWQLHPASPISVDNRDARNGGPITEYDGKIYRIAQDCSGAYGGGLNAYEITELTPTTYSERKSKPLLPIGRFPLGGHQLSTVNFKGRDTIAIDYLSSRFFVKDVVNRVAHKIGS